MSDAPKPRIGLSEGDGHDWRHPVPVMLRKGLDPSMPESGRRVLITLPLNDDGRHVGRISVLAGCAVQVAIESQDGSDRSIYYFNPAELFEAVQSVHNAGQLGFELPTVAVPVPDPPKMAGPQSEPPLSAMGEMSDRPVDVLGWLLSFVCQLTTADLARVIHDTNYKGSAKYSAELIEENLERCKSMGWRAIAAHATEPRSDSPKVAAVVPDGSVEYRIIGGGDWGGTEMFEVSRGTDLARQWVMLRETLGKDDHAGPHHFRAQVRHVGPWVDHEEPVVSEPKGETDE
jgi:hypothetical protein